MAFAENISFMRQKPECCHLSFPTFKRYLNHQRDYHSHEPGFAIRCPGKSCFRAYSKISSLKSHLSRWHKNENSGFDLDNVEDVSIPFDNPEVDHPLNELVENTPNARETFTKKHLALFALKIQEVNRLTDTTTNSLINNTAELLERHESHLKGKIESCLEESGIDIKGINGLDEIMKTVQTPSMNFLKTTKSRNKYNTKELNMLVCMWSL